VMDRDRRPLRALQRKACVSRRHACLQRSAAPAYVSYASRTPTRVHVTNTETALKKK
jgi:hypothetical protein